MEASKTLFEFLDNLLPAYENPLGVNIYMNTDSTLVLCSDYPGVPDSEFVSLELFQELKTFKKLKSLLQIKTPRQLQLLTPTNLLSLYERGRMTVICMLGDTIEMRFIKHRNCIWAKGSDREIHQVTAPLNTAEDFIKYTSHYYEVEIPNPSDTL